MTKLIQKMEMKTCPTCNDEAIFWGDTNQFIFSHRLGVCKNNEWDSVRHFIRSL